MKVNLPKDFVKSYFQYYFNIINLNNYLEFL